MPTGPKEWRPGGGPGERLLDRLKRVAPNLYFAVVFTADHHTRWDGNPEDDPTEDGYQCYNVDFFARAIEEGNIKEGQSSLGSHWAKPGNLDKDVSGYMPQKLEEAAEDLRRQTYGSRRREAQTAITFLKDVMRKRYDLEQGGRS